MDTAAPAVTIGTEEAQLAGVTARAEEAAARLWQSEPAERARWLRAVADAIEAVRDDLVELAGQETSLTEGRLTGEVARTTGQLRLFADVAEEGSYLDATIDHGDPDATPPRPDVRRMMRPLGPVAVFSAGNFPFAFSVAGTDTASALAAGCPVVVKAHPGHPRTSEATARATLDALLEAGAPEGAFSCVEGVEIGRRLVLDPAVRAVGFTGSMAGAQALMETMASRTEPAPFYGELGSINPVVITEEAARARPEELAAGLVGSFTLGVGQFCTKPGLVLVPRGAGFERAVAAAVADEKGGRMLDPRFSAAYAESLRAVTATGHVDVVAGDPHGATADGSASPVVLATSVSSLTAAPESLLDECFGPVTILAAYEDEAELRQAIEALPGSLSATIHAEEHEAGALSGLVTELEAMAGRVIFGGWPTGVAVNWAMHHGGPWPATTNPQHTSVGAAAIRRFLRPVCYQNMPAALLPAALREEGAPAIPRRVDGRLVLPS